ncbi:PilW family protein [Calidifontibacillus oryziterrae]|uniref:PilW family protein n=1 Tax=Calidifontibacillus oryziterrae TaxID=1191699 RepID=UPI0002FE554B|nr:prepilin-type N-terminal cleavage/methylation domain-containing protein [Calidifontibacillus oryziterrae]
MRKFVNLNQRGMTLVETLITLLISTLILGSIYSVFTMGIKYYNKIAIEGQLRDEADYIIASILNEIYRLSPDEINDCGTPDFCFSAENNKILKGSKVKDSLDLYNVIEEDNPNPGSITVRVESDNLILQKSIENDDGTIETSEYEINGNRISVEDSKLFFECTNPDFDPSTNKTICKANATINISLTLKHLDYHDPSNPIYVEPITYISSIGF